MTGINLIILGVVTFTLIILVLVIIILLAKSKLVSSGNATLSINNDPDLTLITPVGNKLINSLKDHNIFVSSACGGRGSCGQCTVVVKEGGGDVLPTEKSNLTRRQINDNVRLSCQVPVKNDMKIELPPQVLKTKKWECKVLSNRNVASFIKELVLELPEGESMDFQAGGYIEIEALPYTVYYRNFNIEDEYRPDWDKYNLWRFESTVEEPVIRAYSMANYPGETGIITLNVRIAIPPPYKPDAPPGQMSSFLFSLKPGDKVTASGPYGDFFVQETDKEIIVAGGGAGMAPLRSIVFDQLKRVRTNRKMSFWYGARNMREAFYIDDFNGLAQEHDNFEWHMALSRPGKHWKGYRGYVHHCMLDLYLDHHPAPEDCEYYICGPPMMNDAVIKMLTDLGVEPENILFDDFGG
jgi:Na+-transporting NADH:ubiquinone oxidoreductase subunit F